MPVSYLLYRLAVALNIASPISSPGDAAARSRRVYIGTRTSKLARVQTEIVHKQLREAYPDVEFIVISKETQGDKNQTTPLHNIGAKSLWTKELEVMLMAGELDIIVHSLKDMPTTLPEGCTIGAICEREDPRDAVVMRAGSPYTTLASLPAGSIVGTSSVRRMAQIARLYPHLVLDDMRGNIITRLRKLDHPADGKPKFAALILAAAGLIRLDMRARCTQMLSHPIMLWSVGQGAIGVECRDGDVRILDMLATVNHRPTALACQAERSLMRTLEGGCSVPIGVDTSWAPDAEDTLEMRALVTSVDGNDSVLATLSGHVPDIVAAAAFGKQAAADLRSQGAQTILDEVNAKRTKDGHESGTVPDLFATPTGA